MRSGQLPLEGDLLSARVDNKELVGVHLVLSHFAAYPQQYQGLGVFGGLQKFRESIAG
jgi:hypothetical protein